MAMFSKPERRWLEQPGQVFDLREFHGSAPTGRVAFVLARMLDERTERLCGKHVVLTVDRRHVTLVEKGEPKGLVIRVPWHSFVDAELYAEPGTPRLHLVLGVRLAFTIVRLTLWFDAAERSKLDWFVARIRHRADEPPPAPPSALPSNDPADVPLLNVRCAPPLDDWVVFLPGDCSAEVLRRVAAAPPPERGVIE